jgi:hypothetical protein
VFNTLDEIFPIGNQLTNHLGHYYQSHAALPLFDSHQFKKLKARSSNATFPCTGFQRHAASPTVRKTHLAAGDTLLDR